VSKGKLFDVLGSDYMVGTVLVKEALDEAKKEFPKPRPIFSVERCIGTDSVFRDYSVEEVEMWLYKYLGDE